MGKTKKVGTTGRFGPRYGSTLRKRIKKIDSTSKVKSKCPKCVSIRVKRFSVGIWRCTKCGHTFTGGAYMPATQRGRKAAQT